MWGSLSWGIFLHIVGLSSGIKCYDCNKKDRFREMPCPGPLEEYPTSRACRVVALSTGEVVQQTVTPTELCSPKDIFRLKLNIARQYRDGAGQVHCCYTDGCNRDPSTALGSIEDQRYPSHYQPVQSNQLKKLEQFAKSPEMARSTRWLFVQRKQNNAKSCMEQ